MQLNTGLFTKAAVISGILGVITLTCSLVLGKIPFFLVLNTDLGTVADYFFVLGTWLGDGAMWVVVLLLALWMKRKDTLPLLISSFVFTTIFTQVCKYLIVPHAPRPSNAISDMSLVHTVPGVELHTVSSFPSGHTATAFTIYLVFSLLLTGNWWLVAGLFYALWVGYSRIYLAQHFPVDAGAGMIVAVVSVLISLAVQQNISRRKQLTA
jgi:membrane-associated phospholipid phosphatase